MKHPQTQSHSTSARSATAAVIAALLATGPVLAQVPAPSTATVTNAPAVTTAPAAIDPELIRQLLLRIEQLEQREAARTNAVTDEVNRKLQQRIAELEQKLGAIEAGGKVLPEIAVTPNDAPTTVELDRKLKDLEEKTAAESEAARVKAAKTPIVSLGSTGIHFSSADTNFTVTLKGLIQTDSHTYFSDNELREGNDTFGTLPSGSIQNSGQITTDPEPALVVKGARCVDYQYVISVLDLLQQLDLNKVGLATETVGGE